MTTEQYRAFRNQYAERTRDLIRSICEYEDRMLHVLKEYNFDEDKGIQFFIDMADDAIIHKCNDYCSDVELIYSAMKQIDAIINPDDDESDDNENEDA